MDKIASKSGKLEILEDLFGRVVKKMKRYLKSNKCDQNMQEFIAQMLLIKPDVRRACLK